MTVPYARLFEPLQINEEAEEIEIVNSTKQKVTISQPVHTLVVKGCSELEFEIEAKVGCLSLADCSRIEVHYGKNDYIGEILSTKTKGTTVCLPEACNMIPGNKEGEILVSSLSEDGQAVLTKIVG
jgi:hypothetical protein